MSDTEENPPQAPEAEETTEPEPELVPEAEATGEEPKQGEGEAAEEERAAEETPQEEEEEEAPETPTEAPEAEEEPPQAEEGAEGAEGAEEEAPQGEEEEAVDSGALLSKAGIVMSDFDSLIATIENPAWEPFKKAKGIQLKRLKGDDGLLHICGEMELPIAATLAEETICCHDLAVRKKWDKKCLKWECLQEFDEHHDLVHYAVASGVIFVSNRSMLLERIRIHTEDGTILMFAQSVDRPDLCPVEQDTKAGLVRAHVHVSGYRIVPAGEDLCRVTFVLKINLNGKLSASQSNKSAERTVMTHADLSTAAEAVSAAAAAPPAEGGADD